MFSDERSELAIPVVGFLLLGLATLFVGMSIINQKWEFMDVSAIAEPNILIVLGGLLAVIAFFALAKAYLIEGASFGIFAILLLTMGMSASSLFGVTILGLMLAVIAVIVAFMSYRAGDLIVLLMSIFTIVAFISFYFLDGTIVADTSTFAVILAAIGFFAVAILAIIQTLFEWMLVQDIAADFAEYMYGDVEECGCGCGCDSEEE